MSDKILDLFLLLMYGQWIHTSVCIKSIVMDLESEPICDM